MSKEFNLSFRRAFAYTQNIYNRVVIFGSGSRVSETVNGNGKTAVFK